jgi:hypothetical protein
MTPWRLLRTKTDETADDTEYAALNDDPADAICADFPSHDGHRGHPYTGIEVVVIGITSAGVPVDRATQTVDLHFVEVFPRDRVGVGGTAGHAVAVVDSSTASTTSVPLNRKVYYELNGAEKFTVLITNDANEAVDSFQIWWKPVTR